MRLILPGFFLLASLWLAALTPAESMAAAKVPAPGQWTVRQTVTQALGRSPAIKREEEAINMQRQNVRQARAGYLPKLDVQASGGAATLPVSRNE